MLTANMLDYRVPTIEDSPPIEVGIVESNDPNGPFGAKEAGEGSLAAFLPALTNAIADAIGLRFNDLPVTPDRVFAALEKRQRARREGNGDATDEMPHRRPPPLRGRAQGGGWRRVRLVTTPLPNPPPQGGREHTGAAARVSATFTER